MQAEIDAGPPPAAPIEILGVNAAGQEAGNPLMVAGCVLPWLQDVSGTDAWGLWDVDSRAVVVVDPFGRAYAVYDLVAHDLTAPADYAELKQILLDAAAVPP